MKKRAYIYWRVEAGADKSVLSASGTNEVLLTGVKEIFDAIITDCAQRNHIPVSVMWEIMLALLKDER
ncbi:hypothetical protein [Treponema vincentii]|uniref:hypothetical protein n=1 Tax=Treponema vincentii TaxID=69710 RepID=UPI0020A43D02|nr:hypothetical protein [Treponema vincentii]UTC47715.1 hypothetical protein E4N73_02110 [Treponema vincentii]